MTFFDDLEFLFCCRKPNATGRCSNHYFDGYYGLQFIMQGKLLLKVGDSEMISANGPFCFFTAPGEKYSYRTPPGETRDHYFVCFKGERAERYRLGGLLPEQPEAKIYTVTDTEKITQLWKIMQRSIRSSSAAAHAEAVHALEKLLLTVLTGQNSRGRYHEYFTKLAVDIENSPEKEWDFTKEAEKLGISLVHFRRLFSDKTGIPLWRYVLECRVRHAAHLLLSTDKLVKEISGDCGFNSVYHFSKEFKNIMNKSPEQYRKSI